MRRLILPLVSLLVLMLCGGGLATADEMWGTRECHEILPTQPDERPRVITIGDSLTVAQDSEVPWRYAMAQMLTEERRYIDLVGPFRYGPDPEWSTARPYHGARNGRTAAASAEDLNRYLYSTPDVAIVMLGQNDVRTRTEPDAFEATVRGLVDGLLVGGVREVVLATVPQRYDGNRDELRRAVLNERLALIADEYPVVTLVPFDLAERETVDGVHPHVAGSLSIAWRLTKALTSCR